MTSSHRLHLTMLAGPFAICRLGSAEPVPAWAEGGEFVCVTRTREELSIICAQAVVPTTVRAERGFSILRVRGPLDMSLVGVIASLAGPLAAAGISIAPVATFDTDYLLVREADMDRATRCLREAGHTVG